MRKEQCGKNNAEKSDTKAKRNKPMPWKPIGYALLCVVVPVVWGLIVYWASSIIERRALHTPRFVPGEEEVKTLPLDYHI